MEQNRHLKVSVLAQAQEPDCHPHQLSSEVPEISSTGSKMGRQYHPLVQGPYCCMLGKLVGGEGGSS